MKLIFKYLKPYILLVLLIIGFTYIQVDSELALPEYMSEIVTNGIQYSGIKENVPELILEEDMDKLLTFVDDKQEVLSHYILKLEGQKVIVGNDEYELTANTYQLSDSDDFSGLIQRPMAYVYEIETNGLDINTISEAELNKRMGNLEDNIGSMSKYYIKLAYDNVGLNMSKVQSNYILKQGLIMIGISFISVIATIGATYFSTNIAAKIATKLRKDVFDKVESFSSSEFSTFSTSSLITRTGNDITKIQNLIQIMLRMMLMAPMMGITAVFKVAKYPSISWTLLVAIGIIIGTMLFLLVIAVPKFTLIQKLVDKINNIMREYLDGMLVIRAFNSEKIEEDKFDEANKEQTRIDRFITRCMSVAMPVMTFVMNGLTIIVTWVAAKQINIDALTVGEMMAFIQHAMHVVISFMFVTAMFFMIPRSLVSAKRVNEVLDTKLTILDKADAKELPSENGILEFKNVYFKYPNAEEYVLEDISFTAKPKETVAFIGSTASGKSTIIKLIPRLFDITKGSIEYCGIDIRDVKQKDLRDRIGYATQKAQLFTGTIKSNIEFGREINNQELNEAIRVSQSQNIIEEKENGINELITQGGTNVSGGQKQRISIARALAKNASIYIFDDCFSALDYETDKKLRKELSELIAKTNATVLIVAQRISTIKNADKIIVLEDGKIVGCGSHKELLDTCKVYQEIANSQLSKEELEYARA